MRAVLQRVKDASVTIDGEVKGKCNNGFLILLGVKAGDSEKEADFLAKKIANLRVFTDENDKMNLSLLDINGETLVISNFTLYVFVSSPQETIVKVINIETIANIIFLNINNFLLFLSVD